MQSNGLATILLMIPVLTVPALAIFGIPQFAPVVASPLDEGRHNDRETRVGNSARPSHDELFDDIDGFDSDSEAMNNPSPASRDRGPSRRSHRNGLVRQTEVQTVPAWGDDLSKNSDEPSHSRRQTSNEPNGQATREPSFGERIPKKASPSRVGSLDGRNVPQAGKMADPVRVVSTDVTDQSILQAGFINDAGDREKPRSATGGIRSRANEPHNSKLRETPPNPLTWQTAVERLNEFEIRSFRLEPGHRPGQFVFICSYTPPDASSVSYRFEAGADEPLKAVEKVLEQIVEWRQRR